MHRGSPFEDPFAKVITKQIWSEQEMEDRRQRAE